MGAGQSHDIYADYLPSHFSSGELDLSHRPDFETYLLLISTDPPRILQELSSRKDHKGLVRITSGALAPLLTGDKLPPALRELKQVTSFRLAFHLLTACPLPAAWARTLRLVDLRGNFLVEFPEALGDAPLLESLDLSENNIRGSLRREVFLPSLRKLNLAGNQLDDVQASFVIGLPSLERVNLSNNLLTRLPVELGYLPLKVALAFLNKLVEPPQDVANQGSAALISYLQAKKREQRASTQLVRQLPPGLGKPEPEPARQPASSGDNDGDGLILAGLTPLQDAILGCMVGAALGDAVGLLTEFMSEEESRFHYSAPLNFADCVVDRHRCKWQPGDFTDDTDQMICILQSVLANKGQVHQLDFARRLSEWSDRGFPDLGDTCGWGIGATVGKVITQDDFLTNPAEAAERVWNMNKSASNGSVMRTAVLGIVGFDSLETVAANTRAICHVTHHDPKCVASSLVVTAFVALMLQHIKAQGAIERPAVLEILQGALDLGKAELQGREDTEEQEREFDVFMGAKGLEELRLDEPPKIGYTYRCLGSAVFGVRSGLGFEEAITDLVLRGGDSDTNAAVCGAMLGVSLGYSKLPRRWTRGLVHRDWLVKQVQELFQYLPLA